MANIIKARVNGVEYDINPAWVDVTDGGLVLNIDKVREVTMRSKVTVPADNIECPGLEINDGVNRVTLAYNKYTRKLNIFDGEGWGVSIPLTKGGVTDTSGTSGTTSGTTPAP